MKHPTLSKNEPDAIDSQSNDQGMPSQPPQGGFEKSATDERRVPRPGPAVERDMGKNMPDRN
jgi:hypothetical protein